MSQSKQKQTSSATIKYWPLLGLYIVGTIVVGVALGILEFAISYFSVDFSSRSLGYVNTLFVTAYLGYRHMKRFGGRPPKYFFWKFNTLIFAVLSIILVPLLFFIFSQGTQDSIVNMRTIGLSLFTLVGLYFLHLLLLVVGWRLGEKTFVRRQAAHQGAKSKS